jgi:autotransporter strand-loop-strand O-heptosyltransferase
MNSNKRKKRKLKVGPKTVKYSMTINTPKGNTAYISLNDGIQVDIGGKYSTQYRVEFWNEKDGQNVHSAIIKNGEYTKPFTKYYVSWRVKIFEDSNSSDEVLIFNEPMSLQGDAVLIVLDSTALGDTLAWVPYAEEFRKKHQCDVFVSTYWNPIFEGMYPNLQFISPGADRESFDAVYIVGAFDDNYWRNKNHWRLIPLQQISADILGIDYVEIRPKVRRSIDTPIIKEKYIAIAEFSTFDCKEWLHPDGWKKVIEAIREQGYQVIATSREQSKQDCVRLNGSTIEGTINNIQHAECFIGVSSGLSWLAWALEVPVVLISGATKTITEMQECYRVINEGVCHGCFADKELPIDRGNRRYCPRNKNMECSTGITPEMVIEAVSDALVAKNFKVIPDLESLDPKVQAIYIKAEDLKKKKSARILFLMPHCSTGGMPEYTYRCVQDLVHAGINVVVAEWKDIAPIYRVQKDRIRKIVPFFSLDGNWKNLEKLIKDFDPTIIHLQEFAEYFLSELQCEGLYVVGREYQIFETTHGKEVILPRDKKYMPDRFVFAGEYHVPFFMWTRVPHSVVEYFPIPQVRPERTSALKKLGLDPSRVHILNVGLFTPGKNQALAFEIARQMPEMMFHFVGNRAENFKHYWEPLLNQDFSPNIRLWGERDDVDLFYASMDAMLFTSNEEFNPLVVKEALSWKMPVIMRRLNDYLGGMYEDNPLVRFAVGIEQNIYILQSLFPTLGGKLLKAYEKKGVTIHVDPDGKATLVDEVGIYEAVTEGDPDLSESARKMAKNYSNLVDTGFPWLSAAEKKKVPRRVDLAESPDEW